LSLPLPQPENYSDWKSFAKALIATLSLPDGESATGGDSAITQYITNNYITEGGATAPPEGWQYLWYSPGEAQLYLGTADYSPPTGSNIVFIDTGNIADAAIEINKIADGAVTTVKVADAAIVNAKIGTAAVLSAQIGALAVTNAKIDALAVNTAQIANAALTSAKIANLAVGTAHIQVAAITSALIADASIVSAKISNVIQSDDWNPTTKAGWRITKSTGLFEGRGIALYKDDGSVAFASGTGINWAAVAGYPTDWVANNAAGYASHAEQNKIIADNAGGSNWNATQGSKVAITGSAALAFVFDQTDKYQIMGLCSQRDELTSFTSVKAGYMARADGTLHIVENGVDLGSIGSFTAGWTLMVDYDGKNYRWYNHSGTIIRTSPASGGSGAVHWARWMCASVTAGASTSAITFAPSPREAIFGTNISGQMTAANITTWIASAAIGTALIQNAAITSALIADASIVSADIANATILTADIGSAQITQALMANASIGNAQIQNLAVASANIQSLAVQNGHIANLAVDKLKVAGGTVVVPFLFSLAAVSVPSSGVETTIGTTPACTVGDGTYGTAAIHYSGWMDGTSFTDAAVTIRMYVSVNGGAYSQVAAERLGIRTSGGDSFAYLSANLVHYQSGQTIAVRMTAQSYLMPGASGLRASVINDSKVEIHGGQR
jgi:hypothetical protein